MKRRQPKQISHYFHPTRLNVCDSQYSRLIRSFDLIFFVLSVPVFFCFREINFLWFIAVLCKHNHDEAILSVCVCATCVRTNLEGDFQLALTFTMLANKYLLKFCPSSSWTRFSKAGFSDESSKIVEFKQKLQDGPQFDEFIAGVVPRNVNSYSDYGGKIKREKGETQR